ncbi:hypothetical protein BGW36DRAFT_428565 [Talaromyces proteolyticus]|uniref:Uncharacterized protein n=1 Tax=Talaromyces proteolyticus TaxID=1131652 RepID=A0AAD4PVI5_9EURO|nr:uncharacterized protein BGW36DRAFT_428565 [Talaromyces proteolyticus]KAH8696560.1 hypothetical protein BGW36DRAFT_428565 [Talaromyces proteolyticus]
MEIKCSKPQSDHARTALVPQAAAPRSSPLRSTARVCFSRSNPAAFGEESITYHQYEGNRFSPSAGPIVWNQKTLHIEATQKFKKHSTYSPSISSALYLASWPNADPDSFTSRSEGAKCHGQEFRLSSRHVKRDEHGSLSEHIKRLVAEMMKAVSN